MTADRAALRQAIARLERGETGREVDPIIATAVGRKAKPSAGDWVVPFDEDSFERCPHYTTSIDAAVTLVPDGKSWSIWHDGQAEVGENLHPGNYSLGSAYDAPTPAAALALAALRARLAVLEAADG